MQHTQVVSSIPGRTRIKVPQHSRNQEDMALIASGIQEHLGPESVEYNTKTGSILVHHDIDQHTLDDVKHIMKDLCVIFADITGACELIPLNDKSEQEDFSSVLYDLNQRCLNTTNGIIDLRFVLPLGLGALGVLQLLTYGLQFELIPWYLLIYLAIDSFIKLNLDPAPAQS